MGERLDSDFEFLCDEHMTAISPIPTQKIRGRHGSTPRVSLRKPLGVHGLLALQSKTGLRLVGIPCPNGLIFKKPIQLLAALTLNTSSSNTSYLEYQDPLSHHNGGDVKKKTKQHSRYE